MEMSKNTRMVELRELIGPVENKCKPWPTIPQSQDTTLSTPIILDYGGQDHSMNSTSPNSIQEIISKPLKKDKELNILPHVSIPMIVQRQEKNLDSNNNISSVQQLSEILLEDTRKSTIHSKNSLKR
jgi:hypothetical protein